MAIGITTQDFQTILSDLQVSVTYSTVTRTVDPIYGQTTTSTYSDSTKNWIFFKHSSDVELKKWGIVEIGDGYAIMPTTDSMSFGDRITFDSDVFEYTPDCKEVLRYVGAVALYRYFTLKLVDS